MSAVPDAERDGVRVKAVVGQVELLCVAANPGYVHTTQLRSKA